MAIPIVGAAKYEQRQDAVAAAASVITRNETRTFGWRTVAEALNSLPGVHITYDRQYTYVGSRGFSLPGDFNTRLLILIDGNRLNDAAYDSALLGHEFPLDIDLVERTEFIRVRAGPYTAAMPSSASSTSSPAPASTSMARSCPPPSRTRSLSGRGGPPGGRCWRTAPTSCSPSPAWMPRARTAGHKLMVGLEYQDNARADLGYEERANPANYRVRIPTSGYDLGIYAQDDWSLTGTVTAILGLRVDFTDALDTQLSPRFGLLWQATPAVILRALYGRAHRAPNANERDYDDGEFQFANPELGAETVDTLELVADYRVAPDLRLRGSGYYWIMDDLIVWNQDALQFQPGETVRARGAELSADKTWDWGGRLRGSLSYQALGYGDGGTLDNAPRWLGKLNFSGPLPLVGLRQGLEVQYVSARQAVDGTDLDGSWLVNLNLIGVDWVKGLEVALGVYNLLDADYQHPSDDDGWFNALDQDGRSVRLKLTYRF